MSNRNNESGTGFFGFLFLLFLALKLTGYIDWSWWWVTAPLWGPLAFILAILVVVVLIQMILDYQPVRRRR